MLTTDKLCKTLKRSFIFICTIVVTISIIAVSNVFGAYGQIDMRSPVSSPVNAGYLYGEKLTSSSTYGHMGLDFASSIGTSVYATYAGKVIKKKDLGNSSYGKYIVIESIHPVYTSTKFYHYYCHLSEFSTSISEGQTISAGTYLGKTGQSGNVTGPHLHYEIRMGADDWYAQRNPEGLLARSSSDGYGAIRGKLYTANGNWARYKRISGATKGTDINYGASYSYYVMANGNPFPDETAYGINYYIARIRTGNITLSYDNDKRTQNITVYSNTDSAATDVYLP
ncbi:MAG: hypothetical protein PWR27_2380 [Petroclostridium sp.]|nr:Peptidase [Clostridia bacterium]MDK2811671.1 hypothetical protein [Petroclostridium sp.]